MHKIFSILLILFAAASFTCCSQEHLIFMKNLRNIKFLSLKDILDESGLSGKKSRQAQELPGQSKPEVSNENIIKSNVESYNRELIIPSDKDFSISIKLSNDFVVLKSVQGDSVYMKDLSRQANGLFLFHSGAKDSKIRFQDFDVDGSLLKNINYYVKIKVPAGTAVLLLQASSAGTGSSAATASQAASGVAMSDTNMQGNSNTDISPAIIASIKGLSPTEALHELSRMLASPDVTDNEKEMIRYKMADIMIGQRSFSDADKVINDMQDQYKKAFYTGKSLLERKDYKDALRHYLDSLGGDDPTRKQAVLDMERLVLAIGAAEKGLIDRLKSETIKYKNDKDFYVSSMLGIARIYQYLPDIYSAREIYESILNGDYSREQKDKAQQAYDQLKKDFLEYR